MKSIIRKVTTFVLTVKRNIEAYFACLPEQRKLKAEYRSRKRQIFQRQRKS
jgi:hypothetical protein